MNGKERMKLAMRGEKPDRVPLMCQLATGHIYKHAGLAPLDYWYTAEGYVEGNIRMVDRYHFDGILSDVGEIRNPDRLNKAYRLEGIADGHLATFEDGEKVFFPPDDNPRRVSPVPSRKITDFGDIEPDAISIWESEKDIPPHFNDILDRLVVRRGTDLSVHGEVGTAFERLLLLTGSTENGLMALLDDPEKCLAILERLNRSVIVFALAQCSRGIDALKLSSPFAGSGFISRGMYETFVLPFEGKVIAAVKEQYGIPCYIHTCGKIGDRLELIVGTGTDGIECLDPAPLGDVDLAGAAEEIGDRVFIKGNLDSVNELLGKSRDEIVETVRKRMEIGKKVKKGYILSTACSLSPRVPAQNVELLYEAVEKYGKYC